MCVLTSVEASVPEQDEEGSVFTAPGVGGVHVGDRELTLDHISVHHATDFCHSLEKDR